MMPRDVPLQVGGVGKGAQVCANDCRLPIAIAREDGSVATGTFTSPVVRQSACPALLGLRALTENRALLDLGKKQLHFLGEGEATIVLPPGSETFQLESAVSGHLLLPCSEFDKVPLNAVQGEHHLFAEGPRSEPCPPLGPASSQDPQPTLADQVPACEPPATRLVSDEGKCAQALSEFSYATAAAVVQKLVQDWTASMQSFGKHSRPKELVLPFGLEGQGDNFVPTSLSKQRPQLTRLLAKMLQAQGSGQPFTGFALRLLVDEAQQGLQPERGHCLCLPVRVPSFGCKLWIELKQGDNVQHEPRVRECEARQYAGQCLPLLEGHGLAKDPSALFAIEPWSSHELLLLTASCVQPCHISVDVRQHLVQLGFPLPEDVEAKSALCKSEAGFGSSVTNASTQDPQPTLSDQVPVAPAVSTAPQAKVHAGCRSRKASSGAGLLRKVLLITIYHSTVTAFLNCLGNL